MLFSSFFSKFWMIMDWKPWAFPIELWGSGFISSPIFPVFIWKLCLILPYGMQRIPKILSKRLLTFIGLDGEIESWAGSGEVLLVCRKTFSQVPSITRSLWRLLGMSRLRVPTPQRKGFGTQENVCEPGWEGFGTWLSVDYNSFQASEGNWLGIRFRVSHFP